MQENTVKAGDRKKFRSDGDVKHKDMKTISMVRKTTFAMKIPLLP